MNMNNFFVEKDFISYALGGGKFKMGNRGKMKSGTIFFLFSNYCHVLSLHMTIYNNLSTIVVFFFN
jgi:hypothetical protein